MNILLSLLLIKNIILNDLEVIFFRNNFIELFAIFMFIMLVYTLPFFLFCLFAIENFPIIICQIDIMP